MEEGLSLKAALNQPQPAYKVRHMKAGIRLATVLFLTGEEIVSKLLVSGAHALPLHAVDLGRWNGLIELCWVSPSVGLPSTQAYSWMS